METKEFLWAEARVDKYLQYTGEKKHFVLVELMSNCLG